ncbi:hypothetical protein J7E71_11905 [Mesobacillus foraminis]|uniref:hypothetical protein n=1 Tax=Mesobacillus foraminis TaxID=279826 RepID=UPI001BE8A892|nr:hypothetical protein [Mesobacillus foraminis]MBT2756659.1 hypothetical protein [Mesobacillus foraminis]
MEYQIMFYGGMAGATLALVLSVFLYIKLNIPQVVKDLTGFTLPGANRISNSRRNSDAEQTGRITNEIKLRKHVEVEGSHPAPTALLSPDGSGAAILTGNPTGTTIRMGKKGSAASKPEAERVSFSKRHNVDHGSGTTLLAPQEAEATTLLSPQSAEATALLREQEATSQLKDTSRPALDETAFLSGKQGQGAATFSTEQRAASHLKLTSHQHLEETALLTEAPPGQEETALLSEAQPDLRETALLTQAQPELGETAILSEAPPGQEETALLSSHPDKGTTSFLEERKRPGQEEARTAAFDETMILSDLEETTVLSEIEGTARQAAAATEPGQEPAFEKEVDIMIVHSSTTI